MVWPLPNIKLTNDLSILKKLYFEGGSGGAEAPPRGDAQVLFGSTVRHVLDAAAHRRGWPSRGRGVCPTLPIYEDYHLNQNRHPVNVWGIPGAPV